MCTQIFENMTYSPLNIIVVFNKIALIALHIICLAVKLSGKSNHECRQCVVTQLEGLQSEAERCGGVCMFSRVGLRFLWVPLGLL